MALDFEDALHTRDVAHLWRDILWSLAQQWAQRILPSAPDRGYAPTPSLLAGDYIMIEGNMLTLFELARGLAGATALLALCSFGLEATRTSVVDLAIVYASSTRPGQSPSTGAAAALPDARSKPEPLLFHPPAPLPSYEVANIKPIDPDAVSSLIKLPPGGTLSPLSIRRYTWMHTPPSTPLRS
ncbi:MAG: hypothetical protein M3O02_08215 [Acidobacteriota bacterium]|nr:hypothetical protein [Acidobacteriota bacterium]